MLKIRLAAIAAMLVAPVLSFAQKPVTQSNTATAVATIQAIDSTARTLTLRNEAGEEDTFAVGPEVTRFNELKVGDKVRMTFIESIAFSLRQPGAPPPTSTESAAIVASQKSKLPAGTISRQMTTTVTVKAIDPKVPSITVVTADGRTVTRKVDNPKNIANVKAGDRIDITYTQALVTSVERTK